MTPPYVFHFFKILIFLVVRGGRGGKGQKMAQNGEKNYLTPYLGSSTSYDCGLWCTSVKWWYLLQFFFSFSKFWFSGFSNINKCQKEILRCVPPSSHVCDFFTESLLFVNPIFYGKSHTPSFCQLWDLIITIK